MTASDERYGVERYSATDFQRDERYNAITNKNKICSETEM
jgi:hypothetical protein